MPTEVGDGLVLDLQRLPVLSGPFLVAQEKAKHPDFTRGNETGEGERMLAGS